MREIKTCSLSILIRTCLLYMSRSTCRAMTTITAGAVNHGEFLERNPVVLAWLQESFALARRDKLAGIVLLFQANPGFAHFSEGLPHRGFRDFLEALRQETLDFPGRSSPSMATPTSTASINRYAMPAGRKFPTAPRRNLRLPADGLDARNDRHRLTCAVPFEIHPWPPAAQ